MEGYVNSFRQFPRAHFYTGLTTAQSGVVREQRFDRSFFPYSERHIQCVWFDGCYRPDRLRTAGGERVIVEDPGRWNLEAGPDFLDAVLLVGQERRRIQGDVEVHIRPEDWARHGHGNNPGYSRVMAHVSYFDGLIPAQSLPPGAIQLSLKHHIESSPEFCFENIDVTAYPYASPPRKKTPCAGILASWRSTDRASLLEAAGQERLGRKTARMAKGIEEKGENQLLYEELMASLGYKHNSVPFRQLARWLTVDALRSEAGKDVIKAYSLMMGVGGLLPSKNLGRDKETRVFVRSLWDHWWKQQTRWQDCILPRKVWRTSGLRPQNNPARRLAAAADLFTRHQSLPDRLKMLNTSEPAVWFKQAESVFLESSMDYWRRRLTFSGKPQEHDTALIGPNRIAAILSNVVIPFLSALGLPTNPLLESLPPEEDNSFVRQTAFRLFGRDHNPALYSNGLRQQGLLQIFHDFCLCNKTACRDCALVPAIKAGKSPSSG